MRWLFVLLFVVGCSGQSGSEGPAGPTGPTGPQGPQGPSGTNKIVRSMTCSGTISGLTGAAGTALNGLQIRHEVAVFSSGDVLATAEVIASVAQISGTTFYSAAHNGSVTGSVIIVNDFATSNFGFWNITSNRTNRSFTTVYTDSSLGGQSPVTINSGAGVCSLQNF